jgi:hypothetical protein
MINYDLKKIRAIVFDVDGVEDGLQVVVSVVPALNDVEPQVDFCYGECNHFQLLLFSMDR